MEEESSGGTAKAAAVQGFWNALDRQGAAQFSPALEGKVTEAVGVALDMYGASFTEAGRSRPGTTGCARRTEGTSSSRET